MSLKITLSRSERILRSVGDQPNGIVGWTAQLDSEGKGEGRVVVSGTMNPRGPLAVFGEAEDVRAYANEEELDLDVAIDALADSEAGMYLWGQACGCFMAIVGEMAPRGRLEAVAHVLADLMELRDALGDRFLDDEVEDE